MGSSQLKPRLPVLQRRHPLARGLMGAWLFTERGGTTARDASGRRGTGTLTNMDPPTDWVGCPYGQALDFDGSNDHVVVTGGRAFDPSPWGGITLAALVKVRSLQPVDPNIREIMGHTGTGNEPYVLRLGDRGTQDKFQVALGATGTTKLFGGTISLDTWYWVVATWDGATIRMYYNGVLQASTAYAGPLSNISGNNLFIGARGPTGSPSRVMDGQIAACLLWNRGLSGRSTARWFSANTGPWEAFQLQGGAVYRRPAVPLLLAATINGVGGASGALQISRLLAGAAAGQGSVTGAAEIRRLLAGNVSGLGATEAELRIERLLAGSAAGAGDVAGSLEIRRLLTGLLAGAGSAAGELEIARLLVGAVAGVGTAAAELLVSRLLAGAVFGTGTLTGELLILRALLVYIATFGQLPKPLADLAAALKPAAEVWRATKPVGAVTQAAKPAGELGLDIKPLAGWGN